MYQSKIKIIFINLTCNINLTKNSTITQLVSGILISPQKCHILTFTGVERHNEIRLIYVTPLYIYKVFVNYRISIHVSYFFECSSKYYILPYLD